MTARWHQLVRRGDEPSRMPLVRLIAFLREPQDRRAIIELRIAPDRIWKGGVRELIRQLFANDEIEQGRVERVGASAIRARLRTTPYWPNWVSPEDVRWAFGFEKRGRRS